jgi:tRNA A-37 threonylcarbamoyl transferase component Bud32
MDASPAGRHLELVLLHELSSGTFARLYLAEARGAGGIDRIVAVKLLRDQWNESAEVLARTRDEARLLARLRHRNIVRVEELTELDGQLAIVMEFVDGLDLRQLQDALVARGQRIGPRAALQITASTASAIEAAFERVPYGLDAPLHVVHRDIKPSNIMVSVEGDVKVLDFGTARSTQALRSAQTGALRFGSLKYMSPERREGDRGEHPADVYALGLVLLELLRAEWTSLLPMDPREHDAAVAAAVNALGPLGMPNADWDVALRRAIAQLLSADPAARPTAAQASGLLRTFADAASGPTLESFAADAVTRLAREIRGAPTGGQLSGTKFVVNVLDSGSRPAAPASAQPSRLVPAAETGPHAGAPGSPETVAQPLGAPRPAPERPMSASPSPDVPAVPAPAPRPAAAPDDAPATERRVPAAVLIGVGALAFVVCLGVLGGGIAWWWSGRSQPVVAPPSAARPMGGTGADGIAGRPVGASQAAAVGPAAPVSVRVEGGTARWLRLSVVDGGAVAEGTDSLSGSVPVGSYVLTAKLVGRPVLSSAIEVPAAGLSLSCTLRDDGVLACAGGPGPLELR